MFCCALWAAPAGVPAVESAADPAAALRAHFFALREALQNSAIGKGLYVESVDDPHVPHGDAYAVVPYALATAVGALRTPAILCESLILHLNVQYCRAAEAGNAPALWLALGKKTLQPLEDTYHLRLNFSLQTAGPDFARVELTSRDGPLDTSNYRIAVEMVALDERTTFMHVQYAYNQGIQARIATDLYIATGGREKIGFTMQADPRGGAPRPVRGLRGMLERNTMRYYLAFDAYLQTLGQPPPLRFEASLERWFTDTERFPKQLHELSRDEYIALKRGQYRRQQQTLLASRD